MDDNYSKLVDIAYNKHISGKLEEAKSIYEKLLSFKPNDVNVLNLYAQLNVSIKNYDKALEIFQYIFNNTQLDSVQLNIAKVYMLKNNYNEAIGSLNLIQKKNESVLRLLASAYTNSENKDEAIKIYEDIINLKNPSFPDFYNISVLYSDKKNNDLALKYALMAYDLNSSDIDINLHLASLYENFSDYENALKYLLCISQINPEVNILYRIGVLYKKLSNDDLAVKYFNDILNIEPDNKDALLNIAFIYRNHDKNVSVKILNKIIEKYPNDTNSILMLYSINYSMMNFQECLKLGRVLIDLSPDDPYSYTYLADALFELYRYEEAVDIYIKAKEFSGSPAYYADFKIATIYSITNKVQEALQILSKYLSENPSARMLYMQIYLRCKNISDVKETFYEYIHGTKGEAEVDDMAKRLFYKLNIDKKYQISEDVFALFKKDADNSMISRRDKYKDKNWKLNSFDIQGKRLLLFNQHGAGDLIMFSRFIKVVQNMASEVILQVAPPFVDLYKYNFPDCKVFSNKDDIDDNLYDVTTNYMSLLYDLNIDLHKLDGKPYLSVDDNLVKEKSELDIMQTSKKKAGIYWQGNPTILTNRSIKLEKFLPLFDLENVKLYSFQISTLDIESNDLKEKLPLADLKKYINNYSDTAAFLKNIDVLISIDTSIANLAGAMGIKTFLLLPFKTEWRWFYDTETTPWYNSVKIFKQSTPGDWDEVISRVKHELTL